MGPARSRLGGFETMEEATNLNMCLQYHCVGHVKRYGLIGLRLVQ